MIHRLRAELSLALLTVSLPLAATPPAPAFEFTPQSPSSPMTKKIIVPGHGPVMRDTTYLTQMADLFASVTKQVKEAPGSTLDEVRQGVDLTSWRDRFAGGSPLKRFLFANYVTGPAVASAYRAR